MSEKWLLTDEEIRKAAGQASFPESSSVEMHGLDEEGEAIAKAQAKKVLDRLEDVAVISEIVDDPENETVVLEMPKADWHALR